MSRAPGIQELGAADLRAWLHECSALVSAHAEELTALDAAIGDADHGANMKRGLSAVEAVLEAGGFETIGALLKKAGMTLVSTVGGASGPLYGTFFMRMGAAAGAAAALDAQGLAQAMAAGVEGIAARGRATTGRRPCSMRGAPPWRPSAPTPRTWWPPPPRPPGRLRRAARPPRR